MAEIFYTRAEVAFMFDVSESAVKAWAKRGRISPSYVRPSTGSGPGGTRKRTVFAEREIQRINEWMKDRGRPTVVPPDYATIELAMSLGDLGFQYAGRSVLQGKSGEALRSLDDPSTRAGILTDNDHYDWNSARIKLMDYLSGSDRE